MSSVTIIKLSVAEAEARRAAIIGEVGCDEEQLRARAESYSLDARELALFDELEGLDYLLGR
ncbi:hypothetical protein [Sinomonas sp. ASV322]|uniref:hypothetical protein n=1 Tax=Sinomonas sp. ASV322 TaxID=3041920 RepID=UPI0027DB1299|nr:hypothetical protein [Sinomonas sp. ASV322]MDQ4501515.1 hypothetical protein [Sinomonas sp. ASV322]